MRSKRFKLFRIGDAIMVPAGQGRQDASNGVQPAAPSIGKPIRGSLREASQNSPGIVRGFCFSRHRLLGDGKAQTTRPCCIPNPGAEHEVASNWISDRPRPGLNSRAFCFCPIGCAVAHRRQPDPRWKTSRVSCCALSLPSLGRFLPRLQGRLFDPERGSRRPAFRWSSSVPLVTSSDRRLAQVA